MSTKKKGVLLLCNFLLVFALYQVLLYLEWTGAPILYMGVTAALTVAFYVVNRGFSRPPKPEDLPAAWSAEEKCAYIEAATLHFKRAQALLLWLLPFLLTLLLDFLALFLFYPLLTALEGIL